jgi:hypothetical protein
LCACSQGDALPAPLGDCPPTCEGGTADAKSPTDASKPDAGNDASTPDATTDATADAPLDSTADAPIDSPDDADDGALLDTGTGD